MRYQVSKLLAPLPSDPWFDTEAVAVAAARLLHETEMPSGKEPVCVYNEDGVMVWLFHDGQSTKVLFREPSEVQAEQERPSTN